MENRVRTGLRIPYDLNTKLIFIARKHGISKNALMLDILRHYVENIKNKEGA